MCQSGLQVACRAAALQRGGRKAGKGSSAFETLMVLNGAIPASESALHRAPYLQPLHPFTCCSYLPSLSQRCHVFDHSNKEKSSLLQPCSFEPVRTGRPHRRQSERKPAAAQQQGRNAVNRPEPELVTRGICPREGPSPPLGLQYLEAAALEARALFLNNLTVAVVKNGFKVLVARELPGEQR